MSADIGTADATRLWEPLAVSTGPHGSSASRTATVDDTASAGERDEIERLFRAAREGEPSATDALCRLMRPRLYRVAWSFLKDRDDADDIAQEALVRALTRRFVIVRKGSARGFMVRIATNLAKNRLRDHKRRREILHDDDDRARQETLADPAAAPDAGLLHAAESARVEAALARLSARQQEVVRLRLLGELPFADVAAALGIREENARVTFSQAKARLQVALREGDLP